MLCPDKEFEEAEKEKGALEQHDERQILDVWVDKMEAALAGGPGKFQSRQLHSASSELPLSFRSLLRDSLSGRLADWQLFRGGLLASPPTCSPPLSDGREMPAALQRSSGGVRGRGGQGCQPKEALEGRGPDPGSRTLSHFRTPLKFKLAKVLFQVMSSALGAH